MDNKYIPAYNKLISYLETVGATRNESIDEFKALDKKALKSALENISSVPNWKEESEKAVLEWINGIHGLSTVLALVVTYDKSIDNLDERIGKAYDYAHKK